MNTRSLLIEVPALYVPVPGREQAGIPSIGPFIHVYHAGICCSYALGAGMPQCLRHPKFFEPYAVCVPYPRILSANAQLWFSNLTSSSKVTPSFVMTAIEYLSILLASL